MINKLNELQETLDTMIEQLRVLTIQLEALKYIKSTVRKHSDKKTTVKKSSD